MRGWRPRGARFHSGNSLIRKEIGSMVARARALLLIEKEPSTESLRLAEARATVRAHCDLR